MKYLEWVYALVVIGLVMFLVDGYDELSTFNLVFLVVAIILSSFMFSFRRNQRILMEKKEKEEAAASSNEDQE